MRSAPHIAHNAPQLGTTVADPDADRLRQLAHSIEHAAHLLPSQGPITVFVHHNTLHAFEDLPFEEGLREGVRILGCEPFLTEDQYREYLVSGRIRHDDLSAVLQEDLGDGAGMMLGFLGTRFSLRMAMLEHPLRSASSAELQWAVAESDAMRRFLGFVHGPTKVRTIAETRHWVMRDLRNENGGHSPRLDRVKTHAQDLFALFGRATVERWSESTWESFCLHLLWRICLDGARRNDGRAPCRRNVPLRHAALIERVTGESCDAPVNDLMIRFCAAYLDQGFANWRLPHRDQGFFRSFAGLFGRAGSLPDRWARGLVRELRRIEKARITPLESIDESLRLLGVDESERDAFVLATLHALPGWAGMIWQMETNAEWTMFPAARGSLVEFLAVRLILDRLAAAYAARRSIGFAGDPADLRAAFADRIPATDGFGPAQRAFLVFQLAQVRGWLPSEIHALPDRQWDQLLAETESFDAFERRRILHRAYERRYRNQALDAVATHAGRRRPWAHESSSNRERAEVWSGFPRIARGEPDASAESENPGVQVICCIDDREESFRRHLEEVDPRCETFGAAGFFGVAMYYRGASDAHHRPLCPVIIKPKHYVNELVAFTFVKEHKRRADTRRVLGEASHRFHQGSRTFLGGALTALGGILASIPMVARILVPRATAQVRTLLAGLVRPPVVTQLTIERREGDPGPDDPHLGYSIDEIAMIVERLLRDVGLNDRFAPIVVLFGHGSSSLNNPHESAYNCGACSGGRGGPNARAFAEMANDPRVRDLLRSRGLGIPAETTFVGGYHNTCDDSVTFFDLDRLPTKHRSRFERICDAIDEARRRNAHERCRRFESAPLTLTAEAALRHVEGRAEDLSQARPEYNHATNALVLVGRRWWSRNLFLDRRAFLQSYDPDHDPDHEILTRVLSAVIPVCAGISLEYYFSCVDVKVLGCGSKLPHNIASLLGVMEGAASDLRPGLSQQMIEIHEPMRALFVVETTPEGMLAVMDRNPVIGRLCRNGWVQLAVIDTVTDQIRVFQDGEFRAYRVRSDAMPSVRSSSEWYRGWRDHLGFAVIEEPQPS